MSRKPDQDARPSGTPGLTAFDTHYAYSSSVGDEDLDVLWSDLEPTEIRGAGVSLNDGPRRVVLDRAGVRRRHWEELPPADRKAAKDIASAIDQIFLALAHFCNPGASAGRKQARDLLLKVTRAVTDDRADPGGFHDAYVAEFAHALVRQARAEILPILEQAQTHSKTLKDSERAAWRSRVAEQVNAVLRTAAFAALEPVCTTDHIAMLTTREPSEVFYALVMALQLPVSQSDISRSRPRRR